MVIFGHRRGGVQPPKNHEITFFRVNFSNSRGGPDPRSPPLDPRMGVMYTPLNPTFISKKTGVCRGIPIFLVFGPKQIVCTR